VTSPIEAAKGRHSLADVARRTGIYLPADRGNWTVRCPMPAHGHPDRTPSMRLYLDQGLWTCFGCSPVKPNGKPRAADVIEWVRATQRLEGWREAVAVLEAGGPLANAWQGKTVTPLRPTRLVSPAGMEYPDLLRTPPDRVHAAMDAAWDFYTSARLHARGVAYLRSRGIDVCALEGYTRRTEVGAAPGGGDDLVHYLRGAGFRDDELVDAGLAHRAPGGGPVADFFRARALIPIRAPDGALAGIVGRNLGDARWAKYKNSPRTVLYDKSVNLYQPLPLPVEEKGRIVVVEGTLDAMAIAIAAILKGLVTQYCPLTQSGRELSAHQVERLAMVGPVRLVLALDGDGAGREARLRLARTIRAIGRTPTEIDLPDGSDPASWLASHGPAGLGTFL